ncbi:ZP domain-containing protein [Trichonephila clavata]|uniref:ZP domain-containing protein n=1 Tax=Trichonephila clavata TaxID=2740835 RepID=A0A8X6FCB2_TRICU|nr:ZP domain-containing protein [Trichonephila clavata]
MSWGAGNEEQEAVHVLNHRFPNWAVPSPEHFQGTGSEIRFNWFAMGKKMFNMIPTLVFSFVFTQVMLLKTLTFSADIPRNKGTEYAADAVNMTLSLVDNNGTVSNSTEDKSDESIYDLDSEKEKLFSFTKTLVVDGSRDLKELVITESLPNGTPPGSSTLELTRNPIPIVEYVSPSPFPTINDDDDSNTETQIYKNEETVSYMFSTESSNYNPNSSTRMVKGEDPSDMTTDAMIETTTLAYPSLLEESETRLYNDFDKSDSPVNLTSAHSDEISNKPYYSTTQSQFDTDMNGNKTLTTTLRTNERHDEIARNEKNYDPIVLTTVAGIPFESTVTEEFKYTNRDLSPPHELYVESEADGITDNHSERSVYTTIPVETDKESFETEASNEDSSMEVKLNVNSTRIPKRIQNKSARIPEGRSRPARPDPGYTHRQETDLARPYRPDSALNQYPYYRPTPDYRTPIIRQDTDYTKSSRPEVESQRPSFRPNYSYTRTSQEEKSSTREQLVVSVTAKPNRPSINYIYVPQGSFGRPYRPLYPRPSSKPTDGITYKPSTSGSSHHDPDIYEHSRADYEYTRQSESAPLYPKISPSDSRRPVKPELSRPFTPNRPGHDFITDEPSLLNPDTKEANKKVSKPIFETPRPSFYPKPGFGGSYFPSDTSEKPFSIGTVVSAKNLTRVEYIKADCFDNHMKVTMRFNGTFDGMVYSSGYTQDASCNYVNGSGRNHYEFFIRLNRCGTLGQQEVSEDSTGTIPRRRQERAQYLVNTVTVQYNPVIEEDIDEHFRVTCEYGYDFWKTVTFPVINVESASVKLRTGNPVVFTLPPPQCNMEVRRGFGPSGIRISGPVNVGDPITLVIHMKSESTGFDILISNCYAHNGAQKRLHLIDSHGCVIQDKLISPFRGSNNPERSQQVTLYSYLKAFRFTGSPALYLECDVHMCHGSCPPQRCYWRNLYKRSAEEIMQTTTDSETVVSESVSLFQALEVRHVDVDSPLALHNPNWQIEDDMICIRTGGFAAMLSCILLLLLLTTCVAVCMCLRMRRVKKYLEVPDTKLFVGF